MTTSTLSSRNVASKQIANPYMPAGIYTPWQRPSDWLTLPSLSSTVVFVGLVAVYDDTNNIVTIGANASTGSYTIDWGDGTTDTNSGAVVKTHQYTYSSLSSGTLTTRGYRQAIVTVTMTSGTLNALLLTQLASISPPVPNYNSNWLDIGLNSVTLDNITIGGGTLVTLNMLENINIQACAPTPTTVNFQSLIALQQITVPSTVNMNTNTLFSGCYSLLAAPMFDTSSQTSMANMFNNCYSLKYVPPYNTSNVTAMNSTFTNCYALESVPQFNTSKVTNMGNMFQGCSKLTNIPYFNTSNVTNMANFVDSCFNLTSIPMFDTSKVTSMYYMFNNCYSLETIPEYNSSNCTVTTNMFANCASLTSIPNLNTSKVNNTSSMYLSCARLTSIPNLNNSNVTNCSFMFQNCSSIVDLSFLNFSNITTAPAGLFSGCTNLVSVPANLDFSLVNTGSATNTFANASKLRGNITINVGGSLSLASAFTQAQDITSVTITGNNYTSIGLAFNNCKNIRNINFSNLQAVTTTTSAFATCTNLTNLRVPNLGVSLTVASTMLDKTALETVFTDLRGNATAQTVAITSAAGADGASSSNLTAGQSAGSTTLTVGTSTVYQVGQWAYNSVCFAPAAVTMTDVGDTVNRTNHGLADGTRVSFATIVSTTGISINTVYYVVNQTVNAFQLSLTPGGSVIPLTTNGSGTLRFEVYVVAKPSPTTVTVSAPTTATTTATALTTRYLNTYIATLKNWIVTG